MRLVEPTHPTEDGPGNGHEPRNGQLAEWARVKAVFMEALQYVGAERRAFLDRAVGDDPGLRQEVESLLENERAAGSFCETPAAGMLVGALTSVEQSTSRLAAGTRLGAYEITGFIAAGGMGAVYRARHTVLGREVAIKTVGSVLFADDAKRRLIREARHASVLTHPNICAIYDVGEAEGMPFIVMEYVRGESLGEIIRRGVPSPGTSLQYAISIAAALEHAHERGIIHRDLKSSNVVVNAEDTAVVLDFGLARRLTNATEAPHGSTITNRDTFAGTPSHMAPEVLRGDSTDARSDVWAFGVLLYELLTGDLPFSGRTPFEMTSAILGDPPRAIHHHVPLALRLVVERCLVKDIRGRYQSVHAVRQALESIKRHHTWPLVGRLLISTRRRALYGAAAAVVAILALSIVGARLRSALSTDFPDRIASLAVLPLENATGDASAAYYADGVTDALVAQLGAASDVHVFSPASTRQVALGAKGAADVGARLGADVVIQGLLRRPNDSIAIDVSIVRPADGRVIWSRKRERHATDVLLLEADIVGDVASAIRANVRREAAERLQLAIAHFERSVELDPTYAPAHAGLADCYNQLGTVLLGGGSPRDYRPRAETEAIKALQIDPSSAEAHAALGYVFHYDLRWREAEREFRRAIELNPSLPLARIWYANLLMSRGRMKEAIDQAYAARALDPFSLVINTNVGWVLHYAERYEEAISQLRQTLTLDSTYQQARSRLIGALMRAGRVNEARQQAHRLVELSDSSVQSMAALALIDAQVGPRDSARVLLDGLLARSRRQYVPPVLVAQILGALGDLDGAMVFMGKAFAEGSNAIAYLAVEPANAPLRKDARFHALLARAGLE